MTLAFLGPVQIAIVSIVVLVLFGPEKMPEIGQQLGRALREVMKARQQFMEAIDLDGKTEPAYEPPRYENYDSTYVNTPSSAIAEEPYPTTHAIESNGQGMISASEPIRGDFASSALSDAGSDYGVSAAPVTENAFPIKSAAGTVPRNNE